MRAPAGCLSRWLGRLRADPAQKPQTFNICLTARFEPYSFRLSKNRKNGYLAKPIFVLVDELFINQIKVEKQLFELLFKNGK